MPRQLTVRGVPDEVAKRLEHMSELHGRSLNATVNQILADAAAESGRRRRLERYATWTRDDVAEFDDALRAQRTVDDELWR